jgi:hypothetical protein
MDDVTLHLVLLVVGLVAATVTGWAVLVLLGDWVRRDRD